MISIPDTQETDVQVLSGAPKVGAGNITEALAVAALLKKNSTEQPNTEPKLTVATAKILKTFLIGLASWKHGQISASAEKATLYAQRNSKERNSFPAKLLKLDLALSMMNQVRGLLKKHHLSSKKPKEKMRVAVISPQDMTIEGMAKYGGSKQIALALFLICPDVFGKFDPTNVAINNQIVHLFWNTEAHDTALTSLSPEKVKLIIPVDPLEAFPDPPTQPLAEGGKPLIKLSGSGGDEDTITALAARLTAINLAPTVICENASKLDPYRTKDITTQSEANWFYHSLGQAKSELPPYLICHPSEQVKHLIVLQKKGIFIPTIFLYPKGLHEVKNLAWAIKHGLSKVICVPKKLEPSGLQKTVADIQQGFSKFNVPKPETIDPRAEVTRQLAEQGIDPSMYRFVDPSEITAADFEKPTKAWEQPPNALSLFDAIRSGLNGTSVTVKA